jgi:predicted TPR repeat methyltransferase
MLEREERWKQAAKNLVPYQKAGVASQAVAIVSALPEFPAFRKMLDLGGGPGIIGQSIVSSHPHRTGGLFDLPMVVGAAESEIRNQGMEDQMSVLSGDYNIDFLGEDYDLVWSSLNLYYAKNLTALIRRIHESLNPGGVFVSFHEGLTDEKTSPPDFVLSRLALSLRGQELVFEQGEIASAMLDASFQSVASRTVLTPHGPVDVDIARKAPQKSRT